MSATIIKTVNGHSGTYECIVVPKTMITVTRFNRQGAAESSPNVFRVGDMAEWDSYNLSYYGPIVAITEKTVTIFDKCYGKNRRLSLESFAWRNYDFNLEKARGDNIETMMYI